MSKKQLRLEEVEASAIAFYGLRATGPAVRAAVYHKIVDWFHSLGHAPEKLSVGAKGFSTGFRDFPRRHKKLLRVGFNDVEDFSINALWPGGDTAVINSGIQVTFDFVPTSASAPPSAFVVAPPWLASLSRDSPLLSLAQTIADMLKPAYGIGYTREYRFGPGSYAWGIVQVPDSVFFGPERDEEEEERISKWGQIGLDEKVYLRGLLRDVYPWNFLTQPQLAAQVGRLTLQQWIQKTPERGQLSPLTDEMMLWSVDGKHIPSVRQQLWEAGVIFDYTKFLDDDETITEREALHRLLPDMGYSPEEIDFIADDIERRRRRQQRRKKKS